MQEDNLGEYIIRRYTWVLDNMEIIKPINAKGKLNIWTYDGEYKIINNK